MKKNCRILTTLLLAWIGLPSCSDEGGGIEALGQISFYGENYLLEQGAIYHDNNHFVLDVKDYIFEDRYQGENGEQVDQVKGFSAEIQNKRTGNFLIGLYEQGLTLSELTKDARGKGACICLRIASPDTSKIVPGKYTYSPNRDDFTFSGYSMVMYESASKKNPEPNELTGGEVEISEEGGIHTVVFKCKTSFGGTVEGIYTGSLKLFDLRKTFEMVNFYKNIRLKALFDKVEYTDLEGVHHIKPDYQRGTSFLRSSNQKIYSADHYKYSAKVDKKGIDIALAYDRTNKAVYFESPVKMRALLWHDTFEDENLFDYSFDLPCHTKYMPAPEDFTNETFEALAKQEDFLFYFVESKVSIPVGSAMPRFVCIQTGNGLGGVIRIREITPESTEMIGGVIYPVNASIVMDVKFLRNFSEQQIR